MSNCVLLILCFPNPTPSPSRAPSPSPTIYPTTYPTAYPTIYPSINPTTHPTSFPSFHPTAYPSLIPSTYPTSQPSQYPSIHPTSYPTSYPTIYPTNEPTQYPSSFPSNSPTTSYLTTISPSSASTRIPTNRPTLTLDIINDNHEEETNQKVLETTNIQSQDDDDNMTNPEKSRSSTFNPDLLSVAIGIGSCFILFTCLWLIWWQCKCKTEKQSKSKLKIQNKHNKDNVTTNKASLEEVNAVNSNSYNDVKKHEIEPLSDDHDKKASNNYDNDITLRMDDIFESSEDAECKDCQTTNNGINLKLKLKNNNTHPYELEGKNNGNHDRKSTKNNNIALPEMTTPIERIQSQASAVTISVTIDNLSDHATVDSQGSADEMGHV